MEERLWLHLVSGGCGVDTQHVFAIDTPDQVREGVRQNIEALAPEGGLVFATIHSIQANARQRITALCEALRTFGIAAYAPAARDTTLAMVSKLACGQPEQ
jgi:hypothetical protein